MTTSTTTQQMAQRIDPAALKRAVPLTTLLAERGVPLRPSGPGRWMGRCPFHEDHRPSLLVDERDQRFHCFACGVHGDVLTFLMRAEGLTFPQACQRLADRAPAAIDAGPAPARERRRRPLALEEQMVMSIACLVYQQRLWREPRALAYLRERGIPERVARSCGLGYADGHSLEAMLRPRSLVRIAQDLGLLRKADREGTGSLREFLAGRIVVPELRGGRCLWFIGRSIDDGHAGSGRPKYLALGGERPLLGWERVAGQREVFVCEGVLDYLTAVAWGLPACSPCGTHLPPDRLAFLDRARAVYGVFDGDAAGRAAAERFAAAVGERWRTIPLPDGCDLNDLGQRPDGRALFFRLLAEVRGGRQQGEEVSSGAGA